MRNIFRSFMRLLGTQREAEETAPASFLPESAEIREETPEVENARFFGEIVNRSIHLSQLASEQAKAGDIDAAIETARGIGSALFYASALREIAIAQTRTGQISEAIETIRRIDDPDDQMEALKHFSAVQSGPGAIIASHTMNIALEAIEEIRDEKRLSENAWLSVMEMAGAGDFTAAVQSAREIGDPAWRSWALQEIATGQANAGDFPAALNSASGISKALYRSWAYRDIAVAQAEAGQIEAALDTARRVEDPEDREQAMAAVEKHKEQPGG
ncbi:MAG: hypothetical protein F4X91_11305 [Nitrospinae bacterium]|nr:hypothetical protein [Nitrospinota bacterium]